MATQGQEQGRRIFISYSHRDRAVAELVAGDLEGFGHQAFIDHQLLTGEDWWRRVLDEIEAADFFLMVVSATWRRSLACQRERSYATQVGVAPIGVAASELALEARDVLETVHIVEDYSGRQGPARLERAIRHAAVGATKSAPAMRPIPPSLGAAYLLKQVISRSELPPQHQLEVLEELEVDLASRGQRREALAALRALRERTDLTPENEGRLARLLSGYERRSRTIRRRLIATASVVCLGAVSTLGWALTRNDPYDGCITNRDDSPQQAAADVDDGRLLEVQNDPLDESLPDTVHWAIVVNGAPIPIRHGVPQDLAYAPGGFDGKITERQYRDGPLVPRDGTLLRYRQTMKGRPGPLFLALGGAVFPVRDPNTVRKLGLNPASAILIPQESFTNDAMTPTEGTLWQVSGHDQVYVIKKQRRVAVKACPGTLRHILPDSRQIFAGVDRRHGQVRLPRTPPSAAPTFSASTCAIHDGDVDANATVTNFDKRAHEYALRVHLFRSTRGRDGGTVMRRFRLGPGAHTVNIRRPAPDPVMRFARCQFSLGEATVRKLG